MTQGFLLTQFSWEKNACVKNAYKVHIDEIVIRILDLSIFNYVHIKGSHG